MKPEHLRLIPHAPSALERADQQKIAALAALSTCAHAAEELEQRAADLDKPMTHPPASARNRRTEDA